MRAAASRAAHRRRRRPAEAGPGARARRALSQARQGWSRRRPQGIDGRRDRGEPRATRKPHDRGIDRHRHSRSRRGAATVLLDERGEDLDSATFADRSARWRDQDRPAVVFIIGGPDGVRPSLRDRPTWPRLRCRHLAAPARADHAAGADLPGRDHSWPDTPTIARSDRNLPASHAKLPITPPLRGPFGHAPFHTFHHCASIQWLMVRWKVRR